VTAYFLNVKQLCCVTHSTCLSTEIYADQLAAGNPDEVILLITPQPGIASSSWCLIFLAFRELPKICISHDYVPVNEKTAAFSNLAISVKIGR